MASRYWALSRNVPTCLLIGVCWVAHLGGGFVSAGWIAKYPGYGDRAKLTVPVTIYLSKHLPLDLFARKVFDLLEILADRYTPLSPSQSVPSPPTRSSPPSSSTNSPLRAPKSSLSPPPTSAARWSASSAPPSKPGRPPHSWQPPRSSRTCPTRPATSRPASVSSWAGRTPSRCCLFCCRGGRLGMTWRGGPRGGGLGSPRLGCRGRGAGGRGVGVGVGVGRGGR